MSKRNVCIYIIAAICGVIILTCLMTDLLSRQRDFSSTTIDSLSAQLLGDVDAKQQALRFIREWRVDDERLRHSIEQIALKGENESTRVDAVSAIGVFCDNRSLVMLGKLAGDNNPRVANEARRQIHNVSRHLKNN